MINFHQTCFYDLIHAENPSTKNEKFLQFFASHGNIINKSYNDFILDVWNAETYIQNTVNSHTESIAIVLLDENSYELLIFVTASLLLGLRTIILNPNESSKNRIEQCGSSIVFSKLAVEGHRTLHIEDDKKNSARQPPRPVNEFELGFFTSGSTGLAKIVWHKESFILAKVAMYLNQCFPGHGIASPLPLNHVYGMVFVFLTSLISRRRIILYHKFDLAYISSSLLEGDVDMFAGTPSMLRILCFQSVKIDRAFQNIQFFFCAGSTLFKELLQLIESTFNFQVIPLYGTTETIGSVLYLPPEKKQWLTNTNIPSCGTPLDGVNIFVKDKDFQTLEANQIGEIHVETEFFGGLASFDPSRKFLSTGDLGYYQKDDFEQRNYFFITGRRKETLKRKELQISLLEVDVLMEKWNTSEKSTSLSVKFENLWLGEALGLFVFHPSGGEAAIKSIRNYLINFVPALYQPDVVIFSREEPSPNLKEKRQQFEHFFSSFSKQILGGIQIMELEKISI